MGIKVATLKRDRVVSYRTNFNPVKLLHNPMPMREVHSGRTPVNVTINSSVNATIDGGIIF